MKWLKDNWLVLALCLIGILILIVLLRGCGNGADPPVNVPDSNVQIRYDESKVKYDTTKTMFEVTKTIVRYDTVFVQKVDTVFIERAKKQDLIVHLRKEKGKIIVNVLNIEKQLLKEAIFDDIGRDFVITSVEDGVIVKKENFYLTGVWAFGDYLYPMRTGLKWDDGKVKFGLKTGVTYLDKMNLNIKTEYDVEHKDLNTGIEFEYKLF